MDAFDCVRTKLDVREFDSKPVPADVKLKVLEAARLTQSGMNVQHWRFILVQDKSRLNVLAKDSTTGPWVVKANFAVIVLTDPKGGFHLIDAGRAVQDMQMTAWNYGVASGVFTGVKEEEIRKDFSIPNHLSPTITIGFGYPARKLLGKKKRQPLNEIAYLDKYGKELEPNQLK
jgi:nitroreductase